MCNEKKSIPFELPPTSPGAPNPVWTGNGFQCGADTLPFLSYCDGGQGWCDDLTCFHEDNAGKNHFIDIASRTYSLQQLKAHLNDDNNKAILEIGCSSGYMLLDMIHAFPRTCIVGSDCVGLPLKNLSLTYSNIPIVQCDILSCPFPDKSFDAIVLLNVLEHIQNDGAALAQIHRILKPGGIVVLEVPAGKELYDCYDETLLHYRRYDANDLTKKLLTAGFEILRQSHLGFFLYPAFRYIKKKNKTKYSSESALKRQVVGKEITSTGDSLFLRSIMNMELRLGHFLTYPIGIRCTATCQRR